MVPFETDRNWTEEICTGANIMLALVVALSLMFVAPVAQTAQAASEIEVAASASAPPLGSWRNLWTDNVDNYSPVIAYNTRHNEYLVVWWNNHGSTFDVYARRVAADGTVLGWFTVASTPNKLTYMPDVVYNPQQDEYFVVYTRQDTPGDHNIYAKRIKWNGSLISSEITVRKKAGQQWKPSVAYNAIDDEYLVVYENYWSASLSDIDAQRVRGHDGALLSWRNIATTPNTYRMAPDVAYLESRNEYLIAYAYQSSPTADGDIYARTASANLFMLSGELKLVANAYNQSAVSIAAGPNEYFAVWEDGPGAGHHTLYGRRIAGNGALSPYVRIRDQVSQTHYAPNAAFSPIYGYVTTWTHNSTGASGLDSYGRTLRPGTDIVGNVFALDKGATNQRGPALGCSDRGECLFAEEDDVSGNSDIWVRMLEVEKVFAPIILK